MTIEPGRVVCAFSLNTRGQRQEDLFEFKTSLVYTVPGHPGLHSKTLSQKKKKKKKKKPKKTQKEINISVTNCSCVPSQLPMF
jgi:hypothetical protein